MDWNRLFAESRAKLADMHQHLPEIERLAWQDTPDWDNWCGHACERVSDYLREQGIEHQIVDSPDETLSQWGHHTWIEFPDGTLLDPTITQFMGEGHPSVPGTKRTAVVPPGHPFAERYDRSQSPYSWGEE